MEKVEATWVAVGSAPSSSGLVAATPADQIDPLNGLVMLHHGNNSSSLMGPFTLQSMLARGYWEDPPSGMIVLELDDDAAATLKKFT